MKLILILFNKSIIRNIFCKLGNVNKYLQIQPKFLSPISIENSIDHLLSIESLTINISDEIWSSTMNVEEIVSFISSHFYEFQKKKKKHKTVIHRIFKRYHSIRELAYIRRKQPP